jgi:hypothetical protein
MKKAQAAMEFLMTYGWAILVVLAAIGALAYFGVLSPERFMPGQCTITGGFSCIEWKLDDGANELRMYIQNNLGVDAENVGFAVKDKDGTWCTTAGNVSALVNGARTNVSVTGCSLDQTSFKGNVYIDYRKSGETETHQASGSITGHME